MDTAITEEIRLTQFSKGAGCGCKISPAVLSEILHSEKEAAVFDSLLVGNNTKDDAAVFDLGKGQSVISTTDFFMPIVDDAYSFGRIAASNSISDVYAMGGKPLMAIAILGWPLDKLPAALAQKVLEGARATCAEAGIPLAGGHSVDAAEPIFGLAVTGMIDNTHLKKNSTSKPGDILFLTKPIGTGVLSTAMKRGVLHHEHLEEFMNCLIALNKVGAQLGEIIEVTAMTDVTGFGLAGHLIEMLEGSGCSAEIYYSAIPVLNGVREYISNRVIPDATYRNWNSYGKKIEFAQGVNVMEAFSLLPDPQTNGGLLISAHPDAKESISKILGEQGLYATEIGLITESKEKLITVLV
jgi:selenide,water dikinase